MPVGLQALETGDVRSARDTFEAIAQIARRFGDADLMPIGPGRYRPISAAPR